MDTELTLEVGQANEFKLALRRCGWTNADVKRLCEGDTLARLLPVVRGLAEVNQVTHVIDCDADPFVPEGWKVEEHTKRGQLSWDPAKLAFYLSKHQADGKYLVGTKLRQELTKEPTQNACLLDYLLDHPHLIPEEWKKDAAGNTRYIFFWSTIYRHSDGNLFVRCLCWDDGHWDWGNGWLGHDFFSSDPALVGAS
jgi:hypothetical protein